MKINSHMDWIHRLFEGAPQNSPKFSSSIHASRCMILSLSGVPELCQSKACSRHHTFWEKVLCITIIQLSNSFLAGTIWKECAISDERPFWIDTISSFSVDILPSNRFKLAPHALIFFMSVWILMWPIKNKTTLCQTTTHQLFWVFPWFCQKLPVIFSKFETIGICLKWISENYGAPTTPTSQPDFFTMSWYDWIIWFRYDFVKFRFRQLSYRQKIAIAKFRNSQVRNIQITKAPQVGRAKISSEWKNF